MDLHWITEAAQKPQNLDEQLYEAAIAKAQPYSVAIYDGAEHDADATARDGRMRYRSVPMIAIRILGETDFTSQPLTDEHKRRFPRAWDIYSKKREQWANTLPLTLLPGLTEAERLELEHLGITDVDALAQSEPLPENLEPLRLLARRVRKPHVRLTPNGIVPA
jgi:hypothetical protein